MIRSILEGTAYGLRQNLEIAEKNLGLRAKDLRAVGGGSKSAIWTQIKADVLKRPITVLNLQETAVLGAAMLGGLASGRFAEHREAVSKASAQPLRVLSPDPETGLLYDQMYESYLSLYLSLKELFERISKVSPHPC
jgi:xylulokinase